MDKIRNLLSKHSSKLKYLFLLGAVIAAINTLSRADYNFVIYLYMFYVWTFMGDSAEAQRQDKIGTFYILVYSLVIDFIWCLFWGGKWDTVPTLMHEMTLFFSWCGILLKLFIAFIVGFMEKDNIQSSLLSSLRIKSQKPDEFVPYESE
jgi:hypothetical protein